MKNMCLRLTTSSLLATMSVFALSLVKPSLPKIVKLPDGLLQGQAHAAETSPRGSTEINAEAALSDVGADSATLAFAANQMIKNETAISAIGTLTGTHNADINEAVGVAVGNNIQDVDAQLREWRRLLR